MCSSKAELGEHADQQFDLAFLAQPSQGESPWVPRNLAENYSQRSQVATLTQVGSQQSQIASLTQLTNLQPQAPIQDERIIRANQPEMFMELHGNDPKVLFVMASTVVDPDTDQFITTNIEPYLSTKKNLGLFLIINI